LIEQYFQSMLDLLATLPIVESSNVNLEKRGDITPSDVPSLGQVLREIEEFILLG